MVELSNWAGNYRYRAANHHAPRTLDELQALVARCDRVKALGTRHSFNHLADTSGDLISLEHFTRIEEPDRQGNTVMVEAGVKYGDLCRFLHDRGFALHNLASLPHISIAGACATATHGSGDRNGNLATAVAAIQIVTADGKLHSGSRDCSRDQFAGMVVGLGALGVVTRLTLSIVPSFNVRQHVYQELPFAQLEEHFEQIMWCAYSVSLFTDWKTSAINQVWIKHRVGEGSPFVLPKARRATTALHPIAGISARNCTEQLDVPGPWHERLPHFRMDFMPSAGEELQSEYFVARPDALAAIRAVGQIRDEISPLLQISEIRTIAADELWMSPCHQRHSVGIHFTWKKDWPAVQRILPLIEELLDPFKARPHWGKLFAMPPGRLRQLYEKLPDFQKLVRLYDPGGKFSNDFLNTYIL